MLQKHKQPSFEAGLLIADKTEGFAQLGKIVNFPVILVVISVFSIGLYTGPKVAGMATGGVTGNMVKSEGIE